MAIKQIRQPITDPTHVIVSDGTDPGSEIGHIPVGTLLSGKQDALVSGTTIKTINGDSILGAGNLTVSGGAASLPEISAGEATSVEQTAFTVPVTVAAFGLTDETALRIAVDYRVTGAPTWTRTTATAVSTLTTVNIALTGLTAETEYEYRGVATDTLNPSIEVLANIRVVETQAAPVVSIDTPTLTVTGSPDAVPETPTLTTSAFSVSNGSDTHQDTDWQILDGTSAVVWESLANSTNKTTINVPSGVLDVATEYTFRARHRGVAHGVSAWGEVVATTLAAFEVLPLMAVAHNTSPFITIYDQQVDSFVKLSNPSSLPSSDGWGVAFSNDDVYMAVSTEASPFVTIYKRSGDDFAKLANPTGGLPTGTGVQPTFSNDGVYLAVAHDNSPFVTIYKRSGDDFTKLANPTGGLPTGTAWGVAFSNDGVYMAVAHQGAPAITIYKRSGDDFAKLANPTGGLPTGGGYGVAFSNDGVYLVVAHDNSPFVTIYKRSGDDFTKLANPTGGLPTGTGVKVDFSSDDVYMAVAHQGAPAITIYKRSGDDFAKLANPTGGLPNGGGWGVAFSNGGVYLAVGTDNSPFVTIYKRSGDDFTKLANPTGGLPPGTVRGVDFTNGGYPQ
jgi:hypothetical protein